MAEERIITVNNSGRAAEWQQTAAAPLETHWVRKISKTDPRRWSTCNFNAVSTYVIDPFKQWRDLRKMLYSTHVPVSWTKRSEANQLPAFLWGEGCRQRRNNHHWQSCLTSSPCQGTIRKVSAAYIYIYVIFPVLEAWMNPLLPYVKCVSATVFFILYIYSKTICYDS